MPVISGGGGGGASAVSVATVTLTNAQVLALPTTAVQLVAAPGAGKLLVPIHATLHLTWVADYTNIDAAASVSVRYGTRIGLIAAVGSLNEASSAVTSGVTGLLAEGNAVSAHLPNLGYKSTVGSNVEGFSGQDDALAVNMALVLAVANGAAGAFTGGDAGNSLKVTLLYYTVTL